jgi:hypothetical protein
MTRAVMLTLISEELAVTKRQVSLKNKCMLAFHEKTRAPIKVTANKVLVTKCKRGISFTQSCRMLKAFNKLRGTEEISMKPKKKGA